MFWVLIFVGIVVLHFLINLVRYINNKRLNLIWKTYWDNFFDKKPCAELISYSKSIENNFKNAGIKDIVVPIAIPAGYGQVATTTAKGFDNIFSADERTMPYIRNCFLVAKGVYRSRMLNSFNPIYWIELVVFLPKNIIKYLGLNSDTIFTKIFQIIFWIVNSVLLVVYQDEVSSFMKKLINSIVQLFR